MKILFSYSILSCIIKMYYIWIDLFVTAYSDRCIISRFGLTLELRHATYCFKWVVNCDYVSKFISYLRTRPFLAFWRITRLWDFLRELSLSLQTQTGYLDLNGTRGKNTLIKVRGTHKLGAAQNLLYIFTE